MTENGFTQLNNHIFDKIRKTRFTECEIQTLLCIIRYTYGFQRPFYNMSFTFIAEDINHTTRAVKYALKELEKRNIILNYKKPGGKINQWGINVKISMWDSEQPFTQEIKGTSQGSEQPFTQEIKGSVLNSSDSEQPFTAPVNNHSLPMGTTIHCPGEQPFTQEIKNKKNIKESILKKEEKPRLSNQDMDDLDRLFLEQREKNKRNGY